MRASWDSEPIQQHLLVALQRAFAVAELDLDGVIQAVNEHFLAMFGCARDQLVGQHHDRLLLPSPSRGDGLQGNWATLLGRLRGGECPAVEQRQVNGQDKVIWTESRYLPVGSQDGIPERILLLATDITEAKRRRLDELGQVTAINRSLAVIEFALDGTILSANENFCDIFRYARGEIVGRHHSLLVDRAYAASAEYRDFWRALRRGDFWQAEYRRVRKDGSDVWIQASYNPVFGETGDPTKIVKFASDITEAKLRAIDDGAKIAAIDRSQAMVELAIDGTILGANDNFLRMLGYTLEEVVGRHHSMFVPASLRDGPAYATFWRMIRSGEFQNAEFPRIAKDGRKVWLRASYNPVLDLRGGFTKIVKFAVDITEDVARREQMQLLSMVADGTGNSVVITDANGVTEYVNAGFARMSGYGPGDLRGRKPGDVLQGPLTDLAVIAELRAALAAQKSFNGELQNYTKAGEPYWVSLSVNPVHDETGRISHFISIQADITERKRAEERIVASNRHLAVQANTDALTGVANRHRFDTNFAEEWRRAAREGNWLSLLLLDVDRFKRYNDQYGHPQGDFCLRTVARAFAEAVRRPRSLVARYGGEEFVILLPGTDATEASRIGEAVRAAIEATGIVHAGNPPYGLVTASLGVATARPSPHDGTSGAEHLLTSADAALYRAKNAGRNRVEAQAELTAAAAD